MKSPRYRKLAAVSLADKLDTIVGLFAAGEKPTGSRDPFALRVLLGLRARARPKGAGAAAEASAIHPRVIHVVTVTRTPAAGPGVWL